MAVILIASTYNLKCAAGKLHTILSVGPNMTAFKLMHDHLLPANMAAWASMGVPKGAAGAKPPLKGKVREMTQNMSAGKEASKHHCHAT